MCIKAVIKDVDYYIPSKELTNEFFIEHFKNKCDTDVTELLELVGRDKRRVCEDNESILTMTLKCSRNLLERNNIHPNDIGLLVFSTGTPEYIQPCNALKLHNSLGCAKDVIVYDTNASCVGMVVTMSQVSAMMRDNARIKYALIVGAEKFWSFTPEDSLLPYSNFGESACSILLENVDTEDRGLLNFEGYTDSSLHDTIVLPSKGMTYSLLGDNVDKKDKMVSWIPFDGNISISPAINAIKSLLERNNLKNEDIKMYFISQFSKTMATDISNGLGEDVDKFKFVGDKVGYTGTTSPFLALSEALKNKEVSKGDYVIFWSVGSGFTCHTSLMCL